MDNAGFSDLHGAKCRIFGLGKSNEVLISYLARQGAEIYVSDKRKSENEITDVLQKNRIINAEILPYNCAQKADLVFRTPSVRPDAKEITDNLALGATLTSEVELFFEKAKGKIYGITGSDGKTTTTSITYELLKRSDPHNTYVGGNIGIPLVSLLDKLNERSVTVCELSSFQLMTCRVSPDFSAITNLTENHLDYHKSMSEYALAKSRIYSHKRCKKLVIEAKCSDIFKMYAQLPQNTIITSGKNICAENGKITYFGSEVLNISDIKLVGSYNVSNFMSAIGLAYPSVALSDIRSVAKEFKGVEHRMELVLEKDFVSYYNCSIDSTPSRTLATLSCFKNRSVILILGGYDKMLDYTELALRSQINVKHYVLCGANKWKIYNALITHGISLDSITVCSDFKEAVFAAIEHSDAGEAVVLSPASASFDMFENFEARGNLFKNIIKNL